MKTTTNNNLRILGVFSIAMITAGSVDSIRNIPATALFGGSLLFFFLLAAILFLLPSAFVAAELASVSKKDGGIYTWVKEAFGQQAGFIAVWFQWIENVIWYPTILSFVAGTLGYLIAPTLVENKFFLMAVIITAFWGATIINLYGIRSSASFSNLCALLGLILPMSLIIVLGAVWIIAGHPLQLQLNHPTDWLPHFHNVNMWVSLTAIILSFCGMEIAAVHSGDVRNPQKTYPRAMLVATLIIMITLFCSSMSLALVLPEAKISLVAGIMQGFDLFFSAYHMHWILPLIAVMLIFGGMGGVSNWIIAPTRGLLFAAQDSNMSKFMLRVNRHGAPSTLLISQAVIVTLVSAVFLLMPSVNASYWLLTALAAQLYMFMYLFMFVAAIRLRYKAKGSQRAGFRIPGGSWGIWLVSGLGIIGSLVTIVVGFVPPANMAIGGTAHYEFLLLLGLLVMSSFPFITYRPKGLL